MNSRALHVDDSIVQMKRLREAMDEIASIQDKAILSSFGVNYADSSDCDDDCSDSDVEDPAERCALETTVPTSSNLSPSLENMTLMKLSKYNWFEFHQRILAETGNCGDDLDCFSEFLSQLPNLSFSEHERSLIYQSKEAFDMAEKDACVEKSSKSSK